MPNEPLNLMDPKHTTVSLIADTGIQCLDYTLDESMLIVTKDYRFYDHTKVTKEPGRRVDRFYLHPLEAILSPDEEETPPLEDQEFESLIDSSITGIMYEDTYKTSVKEALKAFDRQWIPIPYFRVLTNSNSVEEGPTNWARLYLASPEKEDDDYRVVIGFDTELCDLLENRPYAAPKSDDANPLVRFQLATNLNDICGFAVGSESLGQRHWQQVWLLDCFASGMSRGRSREYVRKDKAQGEPWAHYVTLISALPKLVPIPLIKLVKAPSHDANKKLKQSEQAEMFVDVDLVLDIGNSRTCGLLAEFGASRERTGLGAQPPTLLRLRQIARPELISDEPFESRVEFHPANFGLNTHGKKSGRPTGKDAFWWPSPVRVGGEATWLAAKTDGRKGVSGMSSPKRYVWDKSKRIRPWENNEFAKLKDGRIPPISGPVPALLREDGSLRGNKLMSLKTSYSRGSLYMLMLVEIICHAVAQINSPAFRYQRSDTDLPRRLRKIILSLPSATPLAERNRMRDFANKAIQLVWKAYDWDAQDLLHPKPKLNFDWDEATCTQLVFLYNELEHRFQEFPRAFFELYGRGRKGEHGAALRVASLDVGGGTTDLMIINHELIDQLVVPKQLFREGIRVAGDDILKDIIEKIVLPTFVEAARGHGDRNADRTMSFLFGGDLANANLEDQTRRSLFVNRILVPTAIRLLNEYEKSANTLSEEYIEFTIDEVVDHTAVTEDLLDYMRKAVSTPDQQTTFDPLRVIVTMQPRQMAGVAEAVIGGVLRDFCDVVRAYQCDILLLSGRPIAMPAIRDIVLASTPTTAERIISMYGYEVGNWYPYRSKDSRIWDPKTTTSVGAMLCHLCEGDYASFSFDARSLKPRSTARYVGKMNQKGQIADSDVVFENFSEDSSAFEQFEARLTTKLDIGYRQLPYARWVTSQLYCAQFKSADKAKENRPLILKLKRIETYDEESEEKKEEFEVVGAYDKNKEPVDIEEVLLLDRSDGERRLKLPLQTYFGTVDQVEAGYWLDSGVLSTLGLIEGDDRG